MIEPEPSSATASMSQQEQVDAIVRSGPIGAITIAGIATAVVVGVWLLFYALVFLPRGALQ
ncbi:hypothetical protein DTW90_25285 [Neorhizobium sp. P12A]|jgi:hypothetical protein|uniref:hypothetical protein n=1 Tax=Neorhizobium sp. P12A TaxID=2268027 RepID=UPI0011EBD826|nr:hypothetical protein [Neorhizobium sp. P12A]KAA0693694.1 hypothetical protein DTW90_25285 [Neorhizobium sp. P12A]